jgi:hypothetical protein
VKEKHMEKRERDKKKYSTEIKDKAYIATVKSMKSKPNIITVIIGAEIL